MAPTPATPARSRADWLPYAGSALLVALVICSLTAAVIWHEFRSYQTQAASSTQSVAQLLAENMDEVLTKADTLLKASSRLYLQALAKGPIQTEDFTHELDTQLSWFQGIADIRVIDAQGMLRYGSGGVSALNLADRDYFIRARDDPTGAAVFSGPMLTRLTEKWVLVVARRVNHPDGRFAGVLNANLDIAHLAKIFSAIDVGPRGVVALRGTTQGEILRYPSSQDPAATIGNLGVSPRFKDFLASRATQATYSATSPLDNIERTYTVHTVHAYPFHIIVGRSAADYLRDWRQKAYFALGLASLMLLLTAAGAGKMARFSKLQAMREGQANAEQILQASPVAMMLIDAQGMIRTANQAAASLVGQTREALIGAPVEGLMPPRFQATHPGWRATFMQQPALRPMDGGNVLPVLHQSGREVPVRIALAPLDLNGKAHVVLALEDQTQHQQQQQVLNDTLTRLKLATEAAEVGIWVWHFDDNTLEWDRRQQDIYRLSEAQAQAPLSYALWRSRVHPDDLGAAESDLAQAKASGSSYANLFRIVLPDGRVRYIQAGSIIEYDASGQAVRMIGVNRDVTQDQEQKNALQEAKQAAEAANIAKSAFLANMSHEIRTPMNAIIGLSTLVLESDLAPQQHDYLVKVKAAAKSLLSLINDILDYSKIEAGHLHFEHTPFDLAEVLHNTVNLFKFRVEEKGLQLHFELSPQVPPTLRGDSLRLGQVLNNLVGNAVKFTPHGEVCIRVALQHPLVPGASEAPLRFEVSDTGIGIDPDAANALFSPFTQADSSITRRFGGTGLGLSISRRLVELMGGTLSVSSVVGQGSSFAFTAVFGLHDHPPLAALPGAAAPASNTPRYISMAAPLRGAEILVVEDNQVNQLVAEGFLTNMGLQVTLVDNGAAAIDRVQHKHFDAVLMDLQMPEMNGYETTRQIRELPAGKTLPIIATTASAMTDTIASCLAVGMNDHISKPLDPEELVARLLLWVAHRPVAEPDRQAPTAAPEPAPLPPFDDLPTLRGLLAALKQRLQDNMLDAKKVAGQIDSLVQDTDLSAPFMRVSTIVRKLRFKEALVALEQFDDALQQKP